jgi:hypothetical protein
MRVSSSEPAVGGYVTPGTRQARLSPLGNRSGKAAAINGSPRPIEMALQRP